MIRFLWFNKVFLFFQASTLMILRILHDMDIYKKFSKTVVLFLFSFITVSAQMPENITTEKERLPTDSYLSIALGLNNATLRDFATSPLVYKGYLYHIGIDFLKTGIDRDINFYLKSDLGYVHYPTPGATYSARQTYVRYGGSYLKRINGLDSESWTIKVGLQGDVLSLFRSNNDLFNASAGFEVFTTLFASAKAEYRFSTNEHIDHKKKDYMFAFSLSPSLLNFGFRNGYAYVANIVLNEPEPLDQYEFKFGGFRIHSKTDFHYYLRNGNRINISYFWAMLLYGKENERIETSSSALTLTLLYKLNHK